MKKVLIVGNWKCNPTSQKEAEQLFKAVVKGSKKAKNKEVIICPPFIYLSALEKLASGIHIGGQDCFFEKQGAYTGEIAPAMLKDAGCEYVIIGHSERRRNFGETDEIINKKLKAALLAQLQPIFCIGETQAQRDGKETERVLERQLGGGLKNIPVSDLERIAVAYEPVWAISPGTPCRVEDAKMAGDYIRQVISDFYGEQGVKLIKILYGGSVIASNAASYIKEGQMQGLLVGGASLKAVEFTAIVNSL